MKKIQVLISLLFFIGGEAYSGILEPFLEQDPSEYELSIVTAGRGNQIYMLGGHLLLRVKEKKENGLDISVNWRIFDFHHPRFMVNYALGVLDYEVKATATSRVKSMYRRKSDNRRLYDNVINLTGRQKEIILKRAAWWLQPENSTYRYHFYNNNCSTIIRDLLSEALGEAYDKQLKEKPYGTFRQMGRRYFSNYPFFAFFAPLMFSSDADLPISYWDRFRVPVEAPDILKEIKAVDDSGNVLSTDLIGPKVTLQEGQDIDFQSFEFSFLVLFFFFFFFFAEFERATVVTVWD